MELSLIELWRATGPLARGVVVLLGGMSLASGAVAADKWRRLRRAEHESDAFLDAWRAAGRSAVTRDLVARFPDSPVAALVGLLADTTGVADRDRAEMHDRTVRRFVLTTGSNLKRGLSTVATVGSTAPFVGLFGTVIGVVNAFHEIGETGRGGIGTVSTGIAEALVTTAFGIMVAIPAVWLFNALSQRITRLLVAIEAAGEEAATAALARRAGAAERTAGGAR
jgi:biopolymer transport protein ExbB/biopolymer transport protein TolQ